MYIDPALNVRNLQEQSPSVGFSKAVAGALDITRDPRVREACAWEAKRLIEYVANEQIDIGAGPGILPERAAEIAALLSGRHNADLGAVRYAGLSIFKFLGKGAEQHRELLWSVMCNPQESADLRGAAVESLSKTIPIGSPDSKRFIYAIFAMSPRAESYPTGQILDYALDHIESASRIAVTKFFLKSEKYLKYHLAFAGHDTEAPAAYTLCKWLGRFWLPSPTVFLGAWGIRLHG